MSALSCVPKAQGWTQSLNSVSASRANVEASGSLRDDPETFGRASMLPAHIEPFATHRLLIILINELLTP
jgi:hypothetical protein